jgi:hypothetical protein
MCCICSAQCCITPHDFCLIPLLTHPANLGTYYHTCPLPRHSAIDRESLLKNLCGGAALAMIH